MSRRPSISGEIFRALIRLFIGILIAFSATLAWTSYSDEARKLVGTWAPAAAWLLPVSPLESLMSRSLLNIAKRSLLRLMLSCVGLASKHAAG